MNDKVTIGTCAICGQENVPVTDDHVPPKTIFLKPRPQNMIEVPACDKCNNGPAPFDQRFGVFLSLHAAEHHPSAETMLRTRTLATLKSNKKLHRNIIQGLTPAYLTTESGIVYEKRDALLWDSEAYDLIIERTIRGFYWKHYNEILGDKATVTVQMWETIPHEISDGFALCSHNEIGQKGELVYKYTRVPESPFNSMWILMFYHSLIAAGFTNPK